MTDWKRPVVIILIMLLTLAVMFVVAGFTEFTPGESSGGAW